MEKFNGLGKMMLAAAFSIMGTVAVGYMTLANKHITRAEASTMIKIESPYMKDKNLILDKLQTMQTTQTSMAATMQRLLENSRSPN